MLNVCPDAPVIDVAWMRTSALPPITPLRRHPRVMGSPRVGAADLVVNVADKAWKNKQVPDLEDLLVARLAVAGGRDAWQGGQEPALTVRPQLRGWPSAGPGPCGSRCASPWPSPGWQARRTRTDGSPWLRRVVSVTPGRAIPPGIRRLHRERPSDVRMTSRSSGTSSLTS
jgi:hypothetical protein